MKARTLRKQANRRDYERDRRLKRQRGWHQRCDAEAMQRRRHPPTRAEIFHRVRDELLEQDRKAFIDAMALDGLMILPEGEGVLLSFDSPDRKWVKSCTS